jgi:2-dehydro-3-deoxyphosphogluconate aldolase/(4S)-4-hydroxy-2-oxoglutarate aldolase
MDVRLDLLEQMRKTRVVPVTEIAVAHDAVPLARALLDGGLACIEVTFRTPAAADAIAAIAAEVPGMVVGAGTVRTLEQAERAVEAGARFLVAPGFNPAVVARAAELGVPMLPGACTPGEIERALAAGIALLKFFPAEAAGGVPYLRSLAGPYPEVNFVPTGGIGPANLAAYLELPTVAACGGSWMVKASLISSGDLATVTRLTAAALSVARAKDQVA